MKRLLLLALLLIPSFIWATTFNSDGTATGGTNSVQALHDAAACHDGDTITIPAGTFTWTAQVHLTKGITLQGAGVGTTIILDDVQDIPFLQWGHSDIKRSRTPDRNRV